MTAAVAKVDYLDNDTQLEVAVAGSSANVTEAGTTQEFRLYLTDNNTVIQNVTFGYTFKGGATFNEDYDFVGLTRLLMAGSTQVFITIIPKDDAIAEGTESVQLVLETPSGAPSGATFIADSVNSQANINIIDNDLIIGLQIVVTDTTGSETGEDGFEFVTSISGNKTSKYPLTVSLALSGTNTADYENFNSTVLILANTTNTISIFNPVNDTIVGELDETLTLSMSGISGSDDEVTTNTDSNSYEFSFTDNDTTVTFNLITNAVTATENATNIAEFEINIGEQIIEKALTVGYTLMGGATMGSDYQSLSDIVVFAANATQLLVYITGLNDSIAEGNETVELSLVSTDGISSSIAVTLASNSEVIDIIDDDTNVVFAISIDQTSGAELNSTTTTFSFAIANTLTIATDATIVYTLSNQAKNAVDYVSLPGTILLMNGSSIASNTLAISADNIIEGNETVTIALETVIGLPSGVKVTLAADAKQVDYIIIDNDLYGTLTLTVLDNNIGEPNNTGTFRIFSQNNLQFGRNLTIQPSVSGSASLGTDFDDINNAILFAENSTFIDIVISPIDDIIAAEGIENIVFQMSGLSGVPSGVTISIDTTALNFFLNDDDNSLTFIASASGNAIEDSLGQNFILSTFNQYILARNFTVDYTILGSATRATDYNNIGLNTVIVANTTNTNIAISPFADVFIEGDETIGLQIETVTVIAIAGLSLNFSNTPTQLVIEDADATITISINTSDVSISETGSETATFIISYAENETLARDITVQFTTSGSSALAGSDFIDPGTTILLPQSTTQAVLIITAIDDLENSELSDIIVVEIETVTSAMTNIDYIISDDASSATVLIQDNDTDIVVAFSSTIIDAIEGGTGLVTVILNEVASVAVTVDFTISGSAISNTDYTTLATNIVIPVGNTQMDVVIASINDNIIERDETITIVITSGSVTSSDSVAISNPKQTVQIQDDDKEVTATISIVKAMASENNETVSFTVGLSPAGYSFAEEIVFELSYSGSATSSDFDFITGNKFEFSKNLNSVVVVVTAIDDFIAEADETIEIDIVTITLPTGFDFDINLADNSLVNTFNDDDNLVIAIRSDASTLDEEGEHNGAFTIYTATTPTAYTDITIEYTFKGTASYGFDYEQLATTLLFSKGLSSATIPLTVIDDTVLTEGDESIIIELITISGLPATVNRSFNSATESVEVTIFDDDSDIRLLLDITALTIAEDNASASFNIEVLLGLALTQEMTVFYTYTGSAVSSMDFADIGTSILMPVGSSQYTITITSLSDDIAEGNETIRLTIDTVENVPVDAVVSIFSTPIDITIADADTNVTVSAVNTNDVEEPNNSNIVVQINSLVSKTAITIQYIVSGSAIAGIDYVALGNSIVIPAYSGSATILVDTLDDSIVEGDETVRVDLINPVLGLPAGVSSNATGGATKVILDDDSEITLTFLVNAATANEGTLSAASVYLTITPTSRITKVDLEVGYTVNGSAVNNLDYVLLSGTALITANSSSTLIYLTPVADNIGEIDETIEFAIETLMGEPAGVTVMLASDAVLVTIDDDDSPLSLEVVSPDSQVQEDDTTNTAFVLQFDNNKAVDFDLLVTVTISGSASTNLDYIGIASLYTLNANDNSLAITINPVSDNIAAEGNESIVVQIVSTNLSFEGTINSNAAELNILDNDTTIELSIAQAYATGSEINNITASFYVFLEDNLYLESSNVTFEYTIAGKAINGTDYDYIPVTGLIPIATTQVIIIITPATDGLGEGPENVILTLTTITEITNVTEVISNSSTEINISDADTDITIDLNIISNNASENGNTGQIDIKLTKPIGTNINVAFTVSGGSADFGDYVNFNSQYQVLNGTTQIAIVITAIDDNIAEGNENIILELVTASGVPPGITITLVAQSYLINIADNDTTVDVWIVTEDATAQEANGDTGLFTIYLNKPIKFNVSALLNFSGDLINLSQNGIDYASISTINTIPALSTKIDLVVTPIKDELGEGLEVVRAELTSISGQPSGITFNILADSRTAQINLVDNPDDTALNVFVDILDSTANENGNQVAIYRIFLDNSFDIAAQIIIDLAGIAKNQTDYAFIDTNQVIAPGSTFINVVILPESDDRAEGDESVWLTVTSVIGIPFLTTVNFSSTPSEITIEDELADRTVSIAVTIPDGISSEFDTSLGTVSPGNMLINFSKSFDDDKTIIYTLDGTASNGLDYEYLDAIVLPAGSNFVRVYITPIMDNIIEGTETVGILQSKVAVLPNRVSQVFTYNNLKVNIFDEDEDIDIVGHLVNNNAQEDAVNPVSGALSIGMQNGNNFVESVVEVTVEYTFIGSAISMSDYQFIPNSIIIPAGSTNFILYITPINDNIIEGDETIRISLLTATSTIDGVSFEPRTGSDILDFVISDDDINLTLVTKTIDGTVFEDSTSDSITFLVGIDGNAVLAESLVIEYKFAGTAQYDTDYNTIALTVLIPVNSSFVNINIQPKSDLVIEGDETLEFTVLQALNVPDDLTIAVATNPSSIATITDSDVSFDVRIRAVDSTVNESGDTGAFGIYISPNNHVYGFDITIMYSVLGDAIQGYDYTNLASTILLQKNSNEVLLPIFAIDDDLVDEPFETVRVDINNLSGFTPPSILRSISSLYDSVSIGIADNNFEVTLTTSVLLDTAMEKNNFNNPEAAVYRIALSNPMHRAITVEYSFSGLAMYGIDYEPVDLTIVLAASSTFVDIALTPYQDGLGEGDESIVISLTTVTGNVANITYNFVDGSNIDIEDNPDDLILTILFANNSVNVVEADITGSFTIRLNIPQSNATTVKYTILGSAKNGIDYRPIASTVLVPAMATEIIVEISPIEDNIIEEVETLQVRLIDLIGIPAEAQLNVSTISSNLSLTDNDNAFSLTLTTNPAAIAEDTNTGNIIFNLSSVFSNNLTIFYEVNGSATELLDFNAIAKQVVVPAGAYTSALSVVSVGDSNIEGLETIVLDITTITNIPIGVATDYLTTVPDFKINDDDNDIEIAFNSLDTSASEDNEDFVSFEFVLLGSSRFVSDFTIGYTLSGATTFGLDYISTNYTAVIPAGENRVIQVITVIDDSVSFENDETLIVEFETFITKLDGVEIALTSNDSMSFTLYDNDASLTVIVANNDNSVSEVNLESASYDVGFATNNILDIAVEIEIGIIGAAQEGLDFADLPDTIEIKAGTTFTNVVLTPLPDSIVEGDETFSLHLIRVVTNEFTSTIFPEPAGRVVDTISDEDISPVIYIEPHIELAEEIGPITASFRINLEDNLVYGNDIQVNIQVSGVATPADYQPISNTLLIPAFTSNTEVIVNPILDTIVEPTEAVRVSIISVLNDPIGVNTIVSTNSNTAQVNIKDSSNVAVVFVTPLSESIVEDGTTTAFRIQLGNVTLSTSILVMFDIIGSAIDQLDVLTMPRSATVPFSSSFVDVVVEPINDLIAEGSETIALRLVTITGQAAGVTIVIGATDTAEIAIIDDSDDLSRVLSFTVIDTTASESNIPANIRINLSDLVNNDLTVQYTFAGGASYIDDYFALSLTQIIAASATNISIRVEPFFDSITEQDETILLIIETVYGASELINFQIDNSTDTIEIFDARPSLAFSTIAVSPPSIIANGFAFTTVELEVFDNRTQKLIGVGGSNIDIVVPAGVDKTGIIDSGNGRYSTRISGDIPGTYQVSAVIENQQIAQTTELVLTPESLGAGLVAWYQADKNVTADINIVQSWEDSSGNRNSATAVNFARYATETFSLNPAINFVDNSYFTIAPGFETWGSDLVMYIVLKPNNLTGSANIIELNETSDVNNNIFLGRNGDRILYSNFSGSVSSLRDDVLDLFVVKHTDTQVAISRNGLPLTQGNNINSLTNVLRSANYLGGSTDNTRFTGAIAEILLFNAQHSDSVSSRIQSYLGLKYGVTLGTQIVPVGYISGNDNIIWEADKPYQTGIAGIGFDLNTSLGQFAGTNSNEDDIVVSLTNNFDLLNTSRTNTILQNDYLIWGNNGARSDTTSSQGAPSFLASIINRVWKFNSSNNSLQVNIKLLNKLPQLGANQQYVLLASSTDDFSGTNVVNLGNSEAQNPVFEDISIVANTITFMTIGIQITGLDLTLSREYETITEGASSAFNINIDSFLETDITVFYTISGGATNGIDYGFLPGNVVIPTNHNMVSIPISSVADNIIEGNENITILIESITGISSEVSIDFSTIQSSIIIQDLNNSVSLIVRAVDDVGKEPTSNSDIGKNILYSIELEGSLVTTKQINVFYELRGSATEGEDYANLNNSIVLNPAQENINILVEPLLDSLIEGDETVEIYLTNFFTELTEFGVNIVFDETKRSAVATIIDSTSSVPFITSERTSIEEASQETLAITIQLSNKIDDSYVTMFYSVRGTATLGKDYYIATPSLIFSNATSRISLEVGSIEDGVGEGDETFTFFITSYSGDKSGLNISLVNSFIDIRIFDDPVFAFQSLTMDTPDVNALETLGMSSPGIFRFSIDKPIAYDVPITYTLNGTAIPAIDYEAITATSVIIQSGSTFTDIPVNAFKDDISEPPETVMLSIIAHGLDRKGLILTINNFRTEVTIIDSNSAPNLSVTPSTNALTENSSSMFEFELSSDFVQLVDTSIEYTVRGSAVYGVDYISSALTKIILAAGTTQTTFSLSIIDDNIAEGMETIVVGIESVSVDIAGVVFSFSKTPIALAITDEEEELTPNLNLEAPVATIQENSPDNSVGLVRLSLSHEIATDIDFIYTLRGTATYGEDYSEIQETLTIAAGQKELLINFISLDDEEEERTESIQFIYFYTTGLPELVSIARETNIVSIDILEDPNDIVPPEPPVVRPTNGKTVSGSAELAASISVRLDSNSLEVCRTSADADSGLFVCKIENELAHNTKLRVIAIDFIGNESSPTLVLVDSQPPAIPIVSPANSSIVTGTAEAGSLVEARMEVVADLLCSEQLETTAINFNCLFSRELEHNDRIEVFASDAAGNTSSPALVVVDTLPPAKPVLFTTRGEVISGTSELESRVVIATTSPIETICDVTVDGEGSFSCTLNPVRNHGVEFSAIAYDLAGNASQPSFVRVDLEIDEPIINPTKGLFISGTTEASATVTVKDAQQTLLCTTLVNSNSFFSCGPLSPMVPANSVLTVTVEDLAGNSVSKFVTVTLDDGDGIDDEEERNGPNKIEVAGQSGADANGDGILDSHQANVATRLDAPHEDVASARSYVTVAINTGANGEDSGSCYALSNVRAAQEEGRDYFTENIVSNDAIFDYPFGLIDYEVNCKESHQRVTIDVFYYGHQRRIAGDTTEENQVTISDYVIRKYGKINGSSQSFFYDPISNGIKIGEFELVSSFPDGKPILDVNGNPTTVAKIQLVLEDNGVGDDDSTNGLIRDPIGVALNGEGSAIIEKQVSKNTVSIGDILQYQLLVINNSDNVLPKVSVKDTLPFGFKLLDDTLQLLVDEVAIQKTIRYVKDNSRTFIVEFDGYKLPVGGQAVITYAVIIGSGAKEGVAVNSAFARNANINISKEAIARVQVIGDPIFDDTTIIGTVFRDANGNNIKDPGEVGIGGARIVTLEGEWITVDDKGRYNYAGVKVGPKARGRNVLLKLDPASLPEGSMIVSENPGIVRVTKGGLSKINFAVRLKDDLPNVDSNVSANTIKITRELEGFIEPVAFDKGQSSLNEQAVKHLSSVLSMLENKSGVRLKVTGLVDKSENNYELSMNRAKAVSSWLSNTLNISKDLTIVSAKRISNEYEIVGSGTVEEGSNRGWILTIGDYTRKSDAQQMLKAIIALGFYSVVDTITLRNNSYYRVLVGVFGSLDEVNEAKFAIDLGLGVQPIVEPFNELNAGTGLVGKQWVEVSATYDDYIVDTSAEAPKINRDAYITINADVMFNDDDIPLITRRGSSMFDKVVDNILSSNYSKYIIRLYVPKSEARDDKIREIFESNIRANSRLDTREGLIDRIQIEVKK